MKLREERTVESGGSTRSRDPLAARRAFWTFLTIFSATIFALSSQVASEYWRCCETGRRASQPAAQPSLSEQLAAAPGAAGAPAHDITTAVLRGRR